MKRRAALPSLMFAAILAASGQTAPSSAGTNEIPKVKAGGIELYLPGPEGDFIEVGDRLSTTVFDLLTPSSNRLLTAYLSRQMQQNMLNGTRPAGGLGLYAMVEIPRGAEYTDVRPQDFQDLVKTVTTSLGTSVDQAVSNTTDEINARVKELGGKPIAVDHPEIVGSLLHKPDFTGWAMLASIKSGDTGAKMVVMTTMIHVSRRVLFAYLTGRTNRPRRWILSENWRTHGRAGFFLLMFLPANVPAR